MRFTRASRRIAALLLTAGAVGFLPAAAQTADQDAPTVPTPGLPVPDDSDSGVVHSWALAPAGASGGSQAGDRANLTYEMTPGTSATDRVTLFNLSNVPLEFEVFPVDAENNDDGAFTPRDRDDDHAGVGAWVRLPTDKVTLGPRQQADFDIAIVVPPDARPGDHAGAILASNDARGEGPDGRIVNVDRQTGTRVYVRVDGELQPELVVARLDTHYTPRAHPARGIARITYRVENRGNVRLGGTHQVSVGGPFGLFRKSDAVRDLPELLPGESLEFTATIRNVAATVAAFTTVDLEPVAVDGADDEIKADDRRAIGLAMPFLLLALAVVAVLIRIARNRYRKRQVALPAPPREVVPRERQRV